MKTKWWITAAFVLLGVSLIVSLVLTQPATIVPALNSFLMIGLGLALGFYLNHRFGLSWGIFGAGVVTFIASQVLHIPFNIFLLNPFLGRIAPQPGAGTSDLALWGILLGLSAGLFEETARYLMLRFWRKDVQTWKQSIMFGAGHAGIEAVLLGVLAFISFVQLVFYRRMGVDSLSTMGNGDQVEALSNTLLTYWNASWYEHLWGALERFSVISIHLAATVLVYQSVRRSNILWYLAAVAWHTLIDFFAVYASQSWGIPATEAIIFGLGLLGWGIVFGLRKAHPPPAPVSEPPSAQVIQPAPKLDRLAQDKPITKESLEESRYE